MGLFDNVFGKREKAPNKDTKSTWVSLTTLEQLDELKERSKEKTQLIFKHSTTCGISGMTWRMFKDSYEWEGKCEPYFLDIHAHRDLSNAIASMYNVRHESPQLLIIKGGEVSFHTSHGAITDINIGDYL